MSRRKDKKTAQPVPVQVICCASSKLDNNRQHLGRKVGNTLTVKHLSEIQDYVFHELEVSRVECAVKLHVPDNCTIEMSQKDLDLKKSGELVVHAHVSRFGDTNRDKANKLQSKNHFGDLAKPSISKSPSRTHVAKLESDVESSLKPRRTSQGTVAKKFAYWRIGTGSDTIVHEEENTITIQDRIVAKVPKAKNGLNRQITFATAQTWTMHQGQVGFYDEHHEFEFNSMPKKYKLDPTFKPFRGRVKDISDYLFDITDRINNNYKLVGGFSKDPGNTTEIHFPPLIPAYASRDDQPFIALPDSRSKEIKASVCLRNQIDATDLGFDDNLQADLKHSDTYASVEEWLLEDKITCPGGLLKHPYLSTIKSGFDSEIWVLPNGHEEMHCWTTYQGMEAWKWLNRRAVDAFGDRCLYIEVHIVPKDIDKGKKRVRSKVKAKGTQKDASDLLSEAVEAADDWNDGDNIDVALVKKSTATKSKVAASIEGDMVLGKEMNGKKRKLIDDIKENYSQQVDEDDAPVEAAKPKKKPCKALGSLGRDKPGSW